MGTLSAEREEAWRRISPYLDQVLGMDPGERETWLLELAATQAAIAGEIRRFLTEYDSLNEKGFLADPPSDLIEHTLARSSSLAGRDVGHYTIERLIGRGGMGEVWLASRNDGRFDGHYAIKFLDTSPLHMKSADRFHREGRLLGRLSHPHIARLIDAGTAEDGRPYLVLEYVDGKPIDRYCRENSIGIEARVRLFLDVVSAVVHAHANLVVHRDLKPSNVLVTPDGTVKLLDFGIAKLLSTYSTRDDDATVTRLEEMALTPEYAAPEQLLGEAPSTATDIYQLGMLLYVLLTDRHPLDSFGSRAERVKAALDGRVPRASELVLPAARRQLRGDLDAILSMALRKDYNERYATAAALREDLACYLNREPVRAQRGATLYRARKFALRHRFAIAGSMTALASLCAALVFAFAQSRAADTERDNALALASRNAAVTEFLGMVITEGADSDTPVTTAGLLSRSENLALADRSGNRENRAAVLAMIASRYSALNDDAKAARLLESALELMANSHNSALRSKLTCAHALSIASLGQVDAAVRAISRELGHLQSDPENAAYCSLYRAYIAINYDDAKNSLQYAAQAIERLRAALRPPTLDEGLFLGALAESYVLNGRIREADQYFQLALQKYAEFGRDGGSLALSVRTSWATMHDIAGMPRRSLELYDQISAIMTQRNPGSTPPSYVAGDRALALEELGRYEEARAAYELELRIATRQQDIFRRVHGLWGLASVAQRLHETQTATEYLEQMSAVMTPSIPAGSAPWISRTLVQGRIELAGGRLESARALFTGALERASGTQAIRARLGKAESELLSGDAAAAADDAQLALKAAMSAQGGFQYSNQTGLAWLMLGSAQRKLGQHGQAYRALDAAVTNLSNTVDERHPALMEARNLLATVRSE